MSIMFRAMLFTLPLGLLLASPSAFADQHKKQSSKNVTAQPAIARYGEQNSVSLADVIKVVAKNTGRVFTVESRLPAEISIGTIELRSMDYTGLLAVLAANGLGATQIDDITAISYLGNARSMPSRVLESGEMALPNELVTRVVEVENLVAAQLVPVLRPLMPSHAHLSAVQQKNALLIFDTFANSERIKAIVERLDAIESE